MKHKLFRLFFILTFVIGLAMVSTPQTVRAAGPSANAYTLTDLGTLGGSNSSAYGINNAGEIVGYSHITGDAETHAFVWNSGVMTDLGTLGGNYSSPYAGNNTGKAINEAGQVIGVSNIAGNASYYGFVWDSGVMTELTLGGSSSQTNAINQAGQVIGQSYLAGDTSNHAFLWDSGVMTDLGTLGGSDSYPVAINEVGQVIGYSTTAGGQQHAFVWAGGIMTDLSTFFGGNYSEANAINEAGQVVGSAYFAGERHAFVWKSGVMTDLGTIFGGSFSTATAINEAGKIVGVANLADNATSHAFVWDSGVVTDLGTLGGTYSSPSAVNQAGQIIGSSYLAGNASYHGFVWDSGVMIDLTLGGSYSAANALNQAGQVVGDVYLMGDNSYHAFVWEGGVMTDLGTFGGFASNALAINEAGQVIGYAYTADNTSYHAFVSVARLANRPANDNFTNAESITSLPFNATVNITDATTESNEPQNCYSVPNTVWYSFTPTASALVKADMAGSSFSDTIFNIYQGVSPGINGLSFQQCAYYGNSTTFSVQSGVTYYIQAGSINNSEGDLHLNLQEIPRPANDDFSSAKAVGLLPFSASLDNTNATTEPGEPQACYYSPNTVWYSFTATANALVKADMQGSSFGDTILNVYQATGPGIYGLSYMQCAYFGNSATFNVQAGTTYYIQAGSIYGSSGNLQLNMQELPRPANADFANAVAATSLPFTATPDVTNGGVESNEPQYCYYMSDTVWYSFTPTVKTLVRANTQGSAISSNLNVYHDTGSGISGLSFLPNGCTVYYGPVTFIAEAGQTYYFQAGGIYGQVGTVQVNLEQLPLPANDDFANATITSAPLPFDNTVDTQYSTRQTGEPAPSCAYYGPGSRSVWYAFTPATSGSYSASIPSAMFTPVMAVYTGNSLTGLSQIGCQTYGSLFTFHANAGTTYYFQVGNFYPWDSGGSMQFHLDVAPQPVASFYTNPFDPSRYDTVQFQDSSYDPGNAGIQNYTWNFGDGTTATGYSASHKYAADGDYQVTHTVTTTDGRTASITQTVQVRTHDVAIAKITTPNSANVGQTKTITVTLRNIAYPETVRIDLYRSTANGFEFLGSVTISVPALSGNRTTAANFSYKFTSEDAKLGKVTFKAVATIMGARDAYPSDNEAISLITKVAK